MKQQQAKGSLLKRLVLSASFITATMAPLTTYAADGILKGRVTDKTDGEGVVGASVVIAGTNIGTSTDINGNFVLRNVPSSAQKVTVSIIGYAPSTQTITVGDGQTVTINFALGQTTIMASEVVVGAALYKQDRLEVPVTANIVSKDKIKEEPNPTLDKVIDEVPGVVVTRAGGTAASGLQIRGSNTYQGGGIGTRVNAFYDGFPINSPETGEIVWQNINMNAADRVEVLKGSAATLYGSAAMGGVVNVYSHMPETMEVKAGSSIGFYDAPPSGDQSSYRDGYTPIFWSSYAGFGNKSGKWTYNFLYTHSNDDGYRQNAGFYANDIKLKVKYDINSRQYVQLSSFYNQTTGGYAYYWPDNKHVFDLASYYHDDTIERKNALVGLNYVNLLSDQLSLDARIYYTRNDSVIDYNKSTLPQGTAIIRFPGDFNETLSNRYGTGIKLDWKANKSHRLLFGIDWNQVDYDTTQAAATITVKNNLQPISETNFALFAQDEWKITSKLTSLISLRYDWSKINADTVTYTDYSYGTYHAPIVVGGVMVSPPYYTYEHNGTVTSNIANQSVSALSPRIALNYKANDDLAFRASWGKSFRAPTIFERFVTDAGFTKGNPNPNLDKETMTAYEVGVFKQFGDKVSLDVAGFLNDYNNLIESSYYLPTMYFVYNNISKARIWGIETNLNYRPNNNWSFNGAYTFMYAKNRSYNPATDVLGYNANNPDPYWLSYRPEHTASLSATWKATSKLAINANARYVSKYKAINMYTNKEGTDYPGDFVVFNASAKYQFTKNISGSLACNNINNTQYEEAEHFRAAGRSVIAGIDLTY
ncbi:MAG: TonB-dependent receptor [Chlorobiaceae bacterium]|nr:TonB-dependent receptor [Chlorobiaceae bacterium]